MYDGYFRAPVHVCAGRAAQHGITPAAAAPPRRPAKPTTVTLVFAVCTPETEHDAAIYVSEKNNNSGLFADDRFRARARPEASQADC